MGKQSKKQRNNAVEATTEQKPEVDALAMARYKFRRLDRSIKNMEGAVMNAAMIFFVGDVANVLHEPTSGTIIFTVMSLAASLSMLAYTYKWTERKSVMYFSAVLSVIISIFWTVDRFFESAVPTELQLAFSCFPLGAIMFVASSLSEKYYLISRRAELVVLGDELLRIHDATQKKQD